MATVQKNAETLRQYLDEVWNKGNMAVIDETMSPDFNFVLAFTRVSNREDFKKMVTVNRQVFENLTYHIDNPDSDMIVDETKGSCFWRMTGKHVGTWRNVPGSNKDVSIQGMTFFKFNDEGKLIEARVQNDVLGLLKQIGGVKEIYD